MAVFEKVGLGSIEETVHTLAFGGSRVRPPQHLHIFSLQRYRWDAYICAQCDLYAANRQRKEMRSFQAMLRLRAVFRPWELPLSDTGHVAERGFLFQVVAFAKFEGSGLSDSVNEEDSVVPKTEGSSKQERVLLDCPAMMYIRANPEKGFVFQVREAKTSEVGHDFDTLFENRVKSRVGTAGAVDLATDTAASNEQCNLEQRPSKTNKCSKDQSGYVQHNSELGETVRGIERAMAFFPYKDIRLTQPLRMHKFGMKGFKVFQGMPLTQKRMCCATNEIVCPQSRAISPITVIAFDIETTGLKLSADRIVEFAARDLAGGECSTLRTLVNPERSVPFHVSSVHGIDTKMVNRPDIPRWKEVAPLLIQFVENRRKAGGPVLLVAHNGKNFDVPFMIKEFDNCLLQIPSSWKFVDTFPLAREAMKANGLKNPQLNLSALCKYYGLPFVGRAHTALADAHMVASVLQRIMIDLKMPVSGLLARAFTAEEVILSPRFQGKLELNIHKEHNHNRSSIEK